MSSPAFSPFRSATPLLSLFDAGEYGFFDPLLFFTRSATPLLSLFDAGGRAFRSATLVPLLLGSGSKFENATPLLLGSGVAVRVSGRSGSSGGLLPAPLLAGSGVAV